MNDNFDKILTKKIEKSFQELEVPYETEHWHALRAKIGSPKNHSILLPTIIKIAAVFLVGIALSLYYFSIPEKEMPISISEELPSEIEQTPPEISSNDSQQMPAELSPDDHQQTLELERAIPGNHSKPTRGDDQGESTASINPTMTKAVVLKQIPVSSLYKEAIPLVSVTDDSSTVITEKLIRVESPRESPIIVQKSDLDTIKPEMGILAASNVGFSKAENGAPVGFSAGFVSAFSITRKVSVSSGLVASHQDLQVEDTGNDITLESNLGEVQKLTQAKLLALDIPVNFRYHIKSSGITRSFLSIGFSSLIYVQQEFNFTTRQVTEEVSESEEGSPIISRLISEQQTNSSRPAFSRFDVASMLNFSIGFQHTLSPKSEIVFEPYVKYPLGSLTDQNVQYGYGGIQIRFVF